MSTRYISQPRPQWWRILARMSAYVTTYKLCDLDLGGLLRFSNIYFTTLQNEVIHIWLKKFLSGVMVNLMCQLASAKGCPGCGECNSWVCQSVPRRDYSLNWLMLLSLVARSCLTLCDPMDCNPPGSSVHGILQARTLEWVAISSSKWYSWPRDRTCLFYIGRQILYHWALSNVDGYHPILWGPG